VRCKGAASEYGTRGSLCPHPFYVALPALRTDCIALSTDTSKGTFMLPLGAVRDLFNCTLFNDAVPASDISIATY
jgi:hypothetical protein